MKFTFIFSVLLFALSAKAQVAPVEPVGCANFEGIWETFEESMFPSEMTIQQSNCDFIIVKGGGGPTLYEITGKVYPAEDEGRDYQANWNDSFTLIQILEFPSDHTVAGNKVMTVLEKVSEDEILIQMLDRSQSSSAPWPIASARFVRSELDND